MEGRGYEGAKGTTRKLLNYWFRSDHRLFDGRKFAYHYSQQRGVETLIYLYEIAQVCRQQSLIETFEDYKSLQPTSFADLAVLSQH